MLRVVFVLEISPSLS